MASRQRNLPGGSPAGGFSTPALLLALCTAAPAVEFAGDPGN